MTFEFQRRQLPETGVGADFVELTAEVFDDHLFVEALGNTNALGRYRDFVRVLELGFRRDSYGMGKVLKQFLDPNLGFTRSEIDEWLSWRNPASHADLRKSQRIAYERDVQPFMERLQQATLDVSAYDPETAKTSATGDLRLTQGVPFTMPFMFPLDCFGAWPVRERGVFHGMPGWWSPFTGFVPESSQVTAPRTAAGT